MGSQVAVPESIAKGPVLWEMSGPRFLLGGSGFGGRAGPPLGPSEQDSLASLADLPPRRLHSAIPIALSYWA